MENDNKIISNTNSNSNVITEFKRQTEEIAEEMSDSENSYSIKTQDNSPDPQKKFMLSELELTNKVRSIDF